MPTLLADITYEKYVTPLHQIDGMTLLIGVFFFWCLAKPERVKNQTQFWATFVCLLGIVVLYAMRLMLYNSPAGQVFVGVCVCALQVGGLVLTVMYVGGLSPTQIGDQLRDAAADLRAGEPAKTPIVPLTGERPKVKAPPVMSTASEPPQPVPPRVVIDLPKRPADERLPLE